MSRVPLKLLVPGAVLIVLLLAVVAFVVVRVAQMSQPPTQPIDFSHVVHAGALKLECVLCHRTVETASAARVPAVEQCMWCHSVAGKGAPEVEKVRTAWERREPINWVRVHRLPDHVRFEHSPHIQGGFECSVCHGQVQEMARVRQVRALNMGDCLGCHRQNNGPTECARCHH